MFLRPWQQPYKCVWLTGLFWIISEIRIHPIMPSIAYLFDFILYLPSSTILDIYLLSCDNACSNMSIMKQLYYCICISILCVLSVFVLADVFLISFSKLSIRMQVVCSLQFLLHIIQNGWTITVTGVGNFTFLGRKSRNSNWSLDVWERNSRSSKLL